MEDVFFEDLPKDLLFSILLKDVLFSILLKGLFSYPSEGFLFPFFLCGPLWWPAFVI